MPIRCYTTVVIVTVIVVIIVRAAYKIIQPAKLLIGIPHTMDRYGIVIVFITRTGAKYNKVRFVDSVENVFCRSPPALLSAPRTRRVNDISTRTARKQCETRSKRFEFSKGEKHAKFSTVRHDDKHVHTRPVLDAAVRSEWKKKKTRTFIRPENHSCSFVHGVLATEIAAKTKRK